VVPGNSSSEHDVLVRFTEQGSTGVLLMGVALGLGRILALYYRSSTLYQIR
jgi:hypothetical protein